LLAHFHTRAENMTGRVIYILPILLFLGSALAHAGVDDGPLKLYRDWVVGCDNWRSCHAVSLFEESGNEEPIADGNLAISIKRAGAPQASPFIELTYRGETSGPLDKSVVELSVDDGWPVLRLPINDGKVVIEANNANRMLLEMRNGKALSLKDVHGKYWSSASLRGLFDALSYMDIKQYRGGTRTALVNLGTKPANARNIPPMPPPPVVRVSAPPKVAARTLGEETLLSLREQDPCIKYSGDDVQPSRANFYRLDSQYTLLILPTVCGGYNPTSQIFVINDDGNVERAQFGSELFAAPRKDDGELTEVTWDQGARLLSSFGRGRGLADCGLIEDFAWSENRFKLVHFSSMSPCRGSWDHITTYRLDVIIEPDR
jgi:hypothetical protein